MAGTVGNPWNAGRPTLSSERPLPGCALRPLRPRAPVRAARGGARLWSAGARGAPTAGGRAWGAPGARRRAGGAGGAVLARERRAGTPWASLAPLHLCDAALLLALVALSTLRQ